MSGPMRVLFLNWRDSGHPEGGGSELYVESVMAGLVGEGHQVTLLTARYPGSPATSERDGYRILRAGGRFTVYPRALLRLVLRRAGEFDVVVDVQNGMPFLSRLVTRKPVVVLCHHVHRAQWRIALGGTRSGRVAAKVGWWVESKLAPRLYRGCRYIAVSGVTRLDLAELGVRERDVRVVHNGTPPPLLGARRSDTPEVVVLGRLVPHKQVEHAVRAVAALQAQFPDLRLTVIGQGWWEQEVRAEVDRLGMRNAVELTGFVDTATKHLLLSRAWVLLNPSVREGWGLCVVEAAAHETPAVAYRSAGGLAESIVDGSTGLLADDNEADLQRQLRRLLVDPELRARTGAAAAQHALQFTWSATIDAFTRVLQELTGPTVTVPSPKSGADAPEHAHR